MVPAYSREVDAPEVVVMLQEPDRDLPAAKRIRPTRTALRPEQQQFVDRQRPFFENTQELLPHGAAGAYDCDFHTRF